MFETWYQVESFLLSGRLNLEPIVTHHLPLTDFERGLKLMQAGQMPPKGGRMATPDEIKAFAGWVKTQK